MPKIKCMLKQNPYRISYSLEKKHRLVEIIFKHEKRENNNDRFPSLIYYTRRAHIKD